MEKKATQAFDFVKKKKARRDKDNQALPTFRPTAHSSETIPRANDAVHLGALASFVVKH